MFLKVKFFRIVFFLYVYYLDDTNKQLVEKKRRKETMRELEILRRLAEKVIYYPQVKDLKVSGFRSRGESSDPSLGVLLENNNPIGILVYHTDDDGYKYTKLYKVPFPNCKKLDTERYESDNEYKLVIHQNSLLRLDGMWINNVRFYMADCLKDHYKRMLVKLHPEMKPNIYYNEILGYHDYYVKVSFSKYVENILSELAEGNDRGDHLRRWIDVREPDVSLIVSHNHEVIGINLRHFYDVDGNEYSYDEKFMKPFTSENVMKQLHQRF